MNYVQLVLRTVLLAALLSAAGISLAYPGAALAENGGVSDLFTVDFTATVKPDIKGDLDLDITGSVTHSYPFTRIEFIHPLTMEQIILVIDGKERLATLLYPDTLNGFSFKYDGRYYEDWPDGFVGFLSENPMDQPPGWSKTVASVDGSNLVEVSLNKDGVAVLCLLNAEGQPTGMEVTTPQHSAVLSFDNYAYPEAVDSTLFAVPSDFAIEQVTELEDDDALPL